MTAGRSRPWVKTSRRATERPDLREVRGLSPPVVGPSVRPGCAPAEQPRYARRDVRACLAARCSEAFRRTIARALPMTVFRGNPGTKRPPGPSAKITQGARPLH